MPNRLNWYGGWSLLLAAFVIGAGLGLFFHREEFLGGYASWRRRLLRLGHIALAALGILNIAYSAAPVNTSPRKTFIAGLLLLCGSVAMPSVCFLSAWKKSARHLFVIPVGLLMGAVILILFWSLK